MGFNGIYSAMVWPSMNHMLFFTAIIPEYLCKCTVTCLCYVCTKQQVTFQAELSKVSIQFMHKTVFHDNFAWQLSTLLNSHTSSDSTNRIGKGALLTPGRCRPDWVKYIQQPAVNTASCYYSILHITNIEKC